MTQKQTLTIEQRLVRMEERLYRKLPGTQITRVMKPDMGFQWCVAIGIMNEQKLFFYGDTIEEAVTKAEEAIFEVHPLPKGVKRTKKNPNPVIFLFPGILATIAD